MKNLSRVCLPKQEGKGKEYFSVYLPKKWNKMKIKRLQSFFTFKMIMMINKQWPTLTKLCTGIRPRISSVPRSEQPSSLLLTAFKRTTSLFKAFSCSHFNVFSWVENCMCKRRTEGYKFLRPVRSIEIIWWIIIISICHFVSSVQID